MIKVHYAPRERVGRLMGNRGRGSNTENKREELKVKQYSQTFSDSRTVVYVLLLVLPNWRRKLASFFVCIWKLLKGVFVLLCLDCCLYRYIRRDVSLEINSLDWVAFYLFSMEHFRSPNEQKNGHKLTRQTFLDIDSFTNWIAPWRYGALDHEVQATHRALRWV